MKKGVTAAIAVVVVLVIVAAALFIPGIIPKSPSSTKGVPGASDVVSSAAVGNSLGGTWTANFGTSGEVTSVTGLQSIVNFTTGSSMGVISGNKGVSENPVISSFVSNGYPAVQPASNYGNYSGKLVGFELGIFTPSTTGLSFAASGFLQYSNATIPSSAFASIYANVTNSTGHIFNIYTYSQEGTTSGFQYIYYSIYTYNSSGSVNESFLLGVNGNFLIFIFDAAQVNLTLNDFLTLYVDQANAAASMAVSLVSTFVTSTQLKTDTGVSWTQDLAAGIVINNPSKLANAYLNSLTNSGVIVSPGSSLIINETLGNLTGMGAALYSSPSSGAPNTLGVVGYLQFASSSAVSLINTTLLGYAALNASVGIGTINGYTYFNLSSSVYNGSTWSNSSELILMHGDYIIFEYFSGTDLFSLAQLKNVASAEASVA